MSVFFKLNCFTNAIRPYSGEVMQYQRVRGRAEENLIMHLEMLPSST